MHQLGTEPRITDTMLPPPIHTPFSQAHRHSMKRIPLTSFQIVHRGINRMGNQQGKIKKIRQAAGRFTWSAVRICRAHDRVPDPGAAAAPGPRADPQVRVRKPRAPLTEPPSHSGLPAVRGGNAATRFQCNESEFPPHLKIMTFFKKKS